MRSSLVPWAPGLVLRQSHRVAGVGRTDDRLGHVAGFEHLARRRILRVGPGQTIGLQLEGVAGRPFDPEQALNVVAPLVGEDHHPGEVPELLLAVVQECRGEVDRLVQRAVGRRVAERVGEPAPGVDRLVEHDNAGRGVPDLSRPERPDPEPVDVVHGDLDLALVPLAAVVRGLSLNRSGRPGRGQHGDERDDGQDAVDHRALLPASAIDFLAPLSYTLAAAPARTHRRSSITQPFDDPAPTVPMVPMAATPLRPTVRVRPPSEDEPTTTCNCRARRSTSKRSPPTGWFPLETTRVRFVGMNEESDRPCRSLPQGCSARGCAPRRRAYPLVSY